MNLDQSNTGISMQSFGLTNSSFSSSFRLIVPMWDNYNDK